MFVSLLELYNLIAIVVYNNDKDEDSSMCIFPFIHTGVHPTYA